MPEEQIADHAIDRIDSEELMASPVLVLQNPVKLLHLDHQLLLILAFVICAIIQVIFGSEGMVVGFVSTLETGMLLLVIVLDLLLVWLYSTRSKFADLKTYLRTVAVVLQDYALLITLNRKYIEVAIIPFTIFAFIYALASKVSKYPGGEVSLRKGLTKSAMALKNMAMVPYLLQLFLVVWTQYKGQVEGHIFVFSSFLLYMGSALCALTVMTASPPLGVSPGVIQVLPAMHKTCIVILMMTAHSMAAEWLGEDMLFACMPEIISVLTWFTIYCHHPEHAVSINSITSYGSLVIILSSVGAILAFLASLYAEDMIVLRAWFLRVFYISSSSWALSYLDVWLLDQWPAESTLNSSGGLVQLLKFSSVISSCVSPCMLCADPHNLHAALKYLTIAAPQFWSLIVSTFQLMLHFLWRPFLSMLVILIGRLAIWLPVTEIEKRVRSTREKSTVMGAGALSGTVDVLDKKLENLQWRNPVSLDISSFRAAVKRMSSASVGPAVLKLVKDIQDWLDLLDRRVEVVTVHISDVINDWSEGSDDYEAIGTAQGSHINKDWFEFSTQYSHDYDAAAATAEHLYKLQSRVNEVTEDLNMVPPTVKPQLTWLYEKQVKYLEEMLADTGWNQPKVVCIFGMAGSGKTNLAMEVYQRIKGQFDCGLWVTAGKNPVMAKLINNMIKQVDSKYIGAGDAAANVNGLTQSLRQLLQNKRYLVVLDDLCSSNDWRTMESCFPQDGHGSWIIITTRYVDAAKAAGDHFCWIPAPVETEVESLFSQKNNECFSGVFASKPHREIDAFEWSGLQWKELEQMKQFIIVRYNGLSADLRACLLYLSIFPVNHKVDIERLERLWLADGFIRGHDGLFTEETTGSYIDELIARKLIEQSSHDHYGTLRSCTVHPLIHEFIVCQAMENKFVSLVHAEQRDVASSNPTARWLSLQNNTFSQKWRHIVWLLRQLMYIVIFLQSFYLQKNTRPAGNLSSVRSVTAFGHARGIPPLTKLTLLRVLDLEGCEGPLCLDGLCELLFLRYLSLRGTDVSNLPGQIGELIYLQTLDVTSTKVKLLPPSIVSLENLMHLLAGNAELPPGMRKMKALVTLSCASAMRASVNSSIKELSEIASLREMELFGVSTQRSWDIFLPPILKSENQVAFMNHGFQSLIKLSIHCSFTSLIFEKGAFPKVRVLELKFDKGVLEESAAVLGIEQLLSLEHVLLDFSQHGRGNAATYTEVKRAAAEDHRKHPNVIVLGCKSE